MVTVGVVVSGGSTTSHVLVAGGSSTLPAGSVARTRNVWAPMASPLIGGRRRARREGAVVERALERRSLLVGGEAERGRGLRRRRVGTRRDRRARRGVVARRRQVVSARPSTGSWRACRRRFRRGPMPAPRTCATRRRHRPTRVVRCSRRRDRRRGRTRTLLRRRWMRRRTSPTCSWWSTADRHRSGCPAPSCPEARAPSTGRRRAWCRRCRRRRSPGPRRCGLRWPGRHGRPVRRTPRSRRRRGRTRTSIPPRWRRSVKRAPIVRSSWPAAPHRSTCRAGWCPAAGRSSTTGSRPLRHCRPGRWRSPRRCAHRQRDPSRSPAMRREPVLRRRARTRRSSPRRPRTRTSLTCRWWLLRVRRRSTSVAASCRVGAQPSS